VCKIVDVQEDEDCDTSYSGTWSPYHENGTRKFLRNVGKDLPEKALS
jgi:hypothetical protein